MNKINVYVTRQITQIGIDMLRNKGYSVEVGTSKTPLKKSDLLKIVKKKKYDAILTLLTDKIDDDFLKLAGPQLKIISNFAIGFDNIDVAAAKARNVAVTNTPGSFSDCIAEHSVALLFALTTRLVEADQFVRKGKYKGWDPMIFVGTDICNKTVGILGTGHIGERFAYHMNKGFGSKIIYYDVKRNGKMENDLGATFFENPDDVIKQADFLSLHVPLLPATHHMINETRLKMMKKSSILINTSRGPVIDEKALVKALKNGWIAGAGLDVYENEPKIATGLTKLPNVVLTPHIASARVSARTEMATLAAQNIIDVMEGREPKYLIK